MAMPPQQKPNNKSGSGFTNLNRYLQANQANRLGQTVSSGVQAAGVGARNALTLSNQEFQAKAQDEQQRLAQQGTKVDQVLGNVSGASDDDVKNFENIRNAESKGPTGVADANALRSKAQEAEALGRAGGSQPGRFGLLQRFVSGGRPEYNAGNQRLDQMLLGQTGQQQLRGARAATFGLGSQAEQNITGAQARGDELKGQARQLADSTIGKLGEQVTGYDAAMQQKLADKKAAINSIIGGVGAGSNAAIELDENRLNQLKDASQGVLSEGAQLYNTDLTPFLKMNELYATKQGAQSAEDLAKAKKIAALTGNSLAGKDVAATLQDYVGREDLAGTFDANNPFEVGDASGLQAAIAKSKGEYDTARGTQNEIASRLSGVLAGRTDTGTGVESSYSNLLKRYSQDQAKQGIQSRRSELQAKQQTGNLSPQELMEMNQLNQFNPNETPSQELMQKYTPEWQQEFDRVSPMLRADPGSIDAPSSQLVQFGNMGGVTDPNSDYLQNIYGKLQPQIDAAMQQYGGGNIQDMLSQIQAARQQYKTALPEQFKTLRTLKKSTPVV